MNLFSGYLNDFFKGRSLYSPVIRACSFLFSACIASALFKWRYYDYVLLDITDYKRIYQFLIGGDFAVPLLLFTITHYSIGFLGQSLFHGMTFLLTNKWTKRIIKWRVGKRTFESMLQTINNNPISPPPEKVTKKAWLQYFQLIKKTMPARAWLQARRVAERTKSKMLLNFKLVFKGCIALTVFWVTVPYFGWKLYGLALFASLVAQIIFVYTYAVLEISPMLVRSVDREMTKFSEDFAEKGLKG